MGPDPENPELDAAKYRLAQAKVGLMGHGGQRPWEQASASMQDNAGQSGAMAADQASAQLDQQRGLSANFIQERDRIRSMADQARERGINYVGEDLVRARQAGEQIVAQRELMYAMQGGNVQAARMRAAELQDAFDQAAIDMDSVRVDPPRWETATPALAQVFMALASSTFAFFSGGRGVNPVVSLIENAIDRDFRAQIKNADTKLKKINLGLDGAIVRDKLAATVETAMYERAAQGLKMMVDNSRDEGARAMAAATYQEMIAKVHDKHADRYDTYIISMAKAQQVANEKQQKAADKSKSVKWNNTKLADQTESSAQSINELDKIWNLYTETLDTAGGKAGRIVGSIVGGEYSPFTTTEGVYNEQKGSLAILQAKAAAGFQVSEPDRQAFEGKLPSIKDSPDVAARKMATLLDMQTKSLLSRYDLASQQDRERMKPVVLESMKQALAFVKKVPQVIPHLKPSTQKLLGGAISR
jgi:hypothetical protein